MSDTTETNGLNDSGVAVESPAQDARGRFLPGNRIGSGSHAMIARRCMQYRKAMFAAVTDEAMQEIARSMISLACQGDVAAAKLIWDQCLGKLPEASVEVDPSSTPDKLVINFISPPTVN